MNFTIKERHRSSSSSFTSTSRHGIGTFLIVLLLLVFSSSANAQTDPNLRDDQYQGFSPSMAVIVVVLVAALFFMAFFSVYIRQCSNPQSAGGSIRNLAGAVTGRSRRAARGLDASVISTFPTFAYSEVKELKKGNGALECAVCLNEFEEDETLRLIPKCDHVFHPDCIDAWLGNHTTCPVCRANLVPQPDDPAGEQTESTGELDIESQTQAVEEQQPASSPQAIAPEPPATKVLNRNRTRGSRSSGFRWFYSRSHSTGHSLVQPGENTERYTLRLPVEVRKQIMNRELNRASSLVLLPSEISSRPGYRLSGGEGSGRGKSSRRLDRTATAKSDRWVFSMTRPFFTRMSSMKTAKVVTPDGEGTSSSTQESKLGVSRVGPGRSHLIPFSQ